VQLLAVNQLFTGVLMAIVLRGDKKIFF
jgi:hypothetical protein